MTVPGDEARWTFDTLHMGRSSIDLYSNDVGVAFEKIRSFGAYVGGSPTNVAVGARRLGLRTALLTAVGDDPVGDLVLRFLQDNGVEVGCSPRKPGHRTSAALLGIEPPDRFSLVFYRDNCADVELTIDDVLAAPITTSRVFQFAGTNLSREPSRSATLFAAERARQAGACVVFDLDFRPDQWHDPRAFGVAARSAFRLVDIVVGTQDELKAAELRDQDSVEVRHSQVTEARVVGDVDLAMAGLLELGPETVVEKHQLTQITRPLRGRHAGGSAGLSCRSRKRPRCGRCVRRGFALRLCHGSELVQVGATGQRLRGNPSHQTRLRQLYAQSQGGHDVRRRQWRALTCRRSGSAARE